MVDGVKLNIVFQKRLRQRNLILKIRKQEVVVSAPFYVSYKKMALFLDKYKSEVLKKINEKPQIKFTDSHFKNHKKYAQQIIFPMVKDLVIETGLKPEKVVIRNQTSRWGSASTKKTISLNYRLAFLPAPLARYVIIHELCHLREMNHGDRFWRLVESFYPDYKKAIKEIRIISQNYF